MLGQVLSILKEVRAKINPAILICLIPYLATGPILSSQGKEEKLCHFAC